jgi:hypothetical protein
MLSKLAGAWLLCALPALAGGGKPADFIAEALGTEASRASLPLTPALRSQARDILGYDYPGGPILHARAGDRSAWVIEGRGKSAYIVSGFVIASNRIEQTVILEYRGSRGRGILAPGFLRQFTGQSLAGPRALDRRVDAVTGATISSGSLVRMACLALRLAQQETGAPEPAAEP